MDVLKGNSQRPTTATSPRAVSGDDRGNTVGIQLAGGAAIIAPASHYKNGIPSNALVVSPITKPTQELVDKLAEGPVAVTEEQMWKLLGFNGPPVQVQNEDGLPVAVGLEDLLDGLEKAWKQEPNDLNRARVLAQELMRHERLEKAEKVLGSIIASGEATGEDWLALGSTQLRLKALDRAEGTLKGAQNLMPDSPYPSLHLARVANQKGDKAEEENMARRAISIMRQNVDCWAYFFNLLRERDGEAAAIAAIESESGGVADAKNAAPYIAMQGFFASNEETRDKAIGFAKKAVQRNPDDPLALLVLSALYGQKNELKSIIDLLQPHEPKMMRDIRLANNYFEALFQDEQIEKVTKLLNALAGSPDQNVRQFAIDRSRRVAQRLQTQQQRLMATGNTAGNPNRGSLN